MDHQDILDDIEKFTRPFDLTAGLGRSLATIAAEEIERQMDRELDPDGAPWPRLNPGYDAWKQTVAPGKPMAELYGVMKTPEQLQGEVTITANHMSQTYGTEQQAKEEAVKFQEGGAVTGTNQPERHFYAFNAGAIGRINDECDTRFIAATG